MANIIELFNPNDKPFGRLSNNSYHPMTIDGKKYDTVTNYIYSNMLTSNTLRNAVQTAKIGVASGVNKELMTAIDFLIVNKSSISTQLSDKRISDNQIIQSIIKNSDYALDEVKSWGKLKQYEYYEQIEKSKKIRLEGGEETKDAWIEYTKAMNERGDEKDIQKRKDFQLLLSREVRKPFESIDLVQLKQQMLAESARNQIGIYQIYNKNKEIEIFDVISDATHKGYESRFQNSELQSILLSTGNLPIQYESHDPFLGIGYDGKGANIVGKVLMQLRHSMNVKSTETVRDKQLQQKYKKIYNIYLSYIVLRREITNNKKQLIEYLGLKPSQIILKYGLQNLTTGVPTQETIIKLYKQDKVPPFVMREMYYPGTLAINVRKMWIGQLRDQLLRDKDDLIFNSYLEYIILKNHEKEINKEVESQFNKHLKTGMSRSSTTKIRTLVIEDIIARQKTELSKEKLSKIKNRVVDLFNLGMLSASLSDRIDGDIDLLQIPSEEDIKEAELAEVLPIPVVKMKIDQEISSVASSGSSDGSPVTKKMKEIFSDKDNKKIKRTDMIDIIISIKGGKRSDYNDWSSKEIKQRLNALDTEKWDENYMEVESKSKSKSESESKSESKSESESIYVQPYGKPIGIFKENSLNPPELVPFNPESFTGMLKINNIYYPTIQHYIISRLIANTGTKKTVDSYGSISFTKGMGISSGHKTILVDPNNISNQPSDFLTLNLAGEVYDKIVNETEVLLFSMYTATSLNKKFEDKSLQDLLILTGNSKINWNSPESYFMGAGTEDNPGKNYVGMTMMDIREKINETRTVESEVTIEAHDLVKFINKDSFIMEWVEMRVSDMCGVVNKLQEYLKFKSGIEIDINEEEMMIKLITYVLDNVYQPCSSLIALSKDVNMPVPNFFINIVNKCKGMSSGIEPITIIDNKGNSKYSKEIKERITENNLSVGRLETEFWGGNRIEHTVTDGKDFEDNQRKDWAEFWFELNKSDNSEKDKKDILKDFKNQQDQEYNDFWGIITDTKTKDEISRHKHQITELKRELSSFLRKKEQVQKHYDLVSRDLAQIYWDRIATMLTALILNVKPSTDANIRNVLVKIGMVNSEKTNCVRILSNESDNCIVSAILNLLTGILKFNDEFSNSTELDEDDVKLAGSIILNTKFNPINEYIKENDSDLGDFDIHDSDLEDEDEDENEDKDEDEDEDTIFDVSPSGYFPSDRDDGQVGYYDENPYFSFNGTSEQQIGSTGDFAKVEQNVLAISSINSKNITMEIMKTLQVVKNSKLSSKIKQNRINFFATIR
jgi:predicted NAD-dependent protein-ADP-ribosyltransferase YbiA (DUF1768 family)